MATTQSPLAISNVRGRQGLASRVATIKHNLIAAKKKLDSLSRNAKTYKAQVEKVERLTENLQQWKSALDGYTPPGSSQDGADEPSQLQPPQQAEPEAIEIDSTAESIEQQQERPIQEFRDENGIDLEEFNGIGEEGGMAGAAASGGGGGGEPFAAVNIGRIGKNAPIYSENQAVFSGSRLMYTWGYNFAEQAHPTADQTKHANRNFGINDVKPLGFEVPWDWIPFYCTPAEWEALDWNEKKIEIDYVEVKVTPVSKTVFFTTGATATEAVSTQHDCYIYKAKDLSKVHGLPIQRFENSAQAIDWTGKTGCIKHVDYSRLKRRFWGGITRDTSGAGGEYGTDVETVKRELEILACQIVSKNGSFGNFLWSEHHDTFEATGYLGKPFVVERFKPKVGLLCDPQRFVPMNWNQAMTNNNSTAPYCQTAHSELLMQDAALLIPQIREARTSNYWEVTTGERIPESNMNLPSRLYQSAAGVRSSGPRIRADFMGGQSYENSGQAADYEPIVTGITSFLSPTHFAEYRYQDTELPVLSRTVDPVYVTPAPIIPAININAGRGLLYGLQSYHAKIEKGNSFIPIGPDSDTSPKVCPNQKTIIIGCKPVLASDPNSDNRTFMKAHVSWKIEYKMVIKQTYVPPQLRYTESSAATRGDNGLSKLPRKANYDIRWQPYGAQCIGKAAMVDSQTPPQSWQQQYSILNPSDETFQVGGYPVKTVRTFLPACPDDSVVFENNRQVDMTRVPHHFNNNILD